MMDRRRFIYGAGLLALTARAATNADGKSAVAETQNGPVRGVVLEGGVRAFTGIPYGAAPMGPLRFAAPRPAERWHGVFDATRPAATPPQKGDPLHLMSENCLQLNVWAPATVGPHPVLVWIYGGGNVGGAINNPMYEGDHFARSGVVCVCVNYRLGVLGFLELGGTVGERGLGSANNAIRDQILALEWVQTNIAAFGGDPRRVTIAGQSAGAGDCAVIMAAPSAKGLFHQAIIASGGGGKAATPAEADAFARVFVEKLGGADKLQTASVDEILAAQGEARRIPDQPGAISPVIDGKFLPAQPMELIRQGSARGIPTMIGHTRDEYRYFMTPEMAAKVPIAGKALSHFKASATGALVEAYARAFPELSLGDRNLRILGADLITLPTTRLAEAQAALAAPVHFYAVHYCVPGGPFARYSAHGIDVPLIFDKLDSLFARQQFGYSAKDEPMALTVSATWASFIKTGVPQDAAGDWRAFDTEDRAAMIFDEPVRMVRDPDQKEREIWDALGAGLN